MGGKQSKEGPERRPLLVLVGPETPSRFRMAQHLITRGNAVVVCDGPPRCPLARGEECGIVATTDAVVILPSENAGREVAISLSMCVRRAARALVVDPTDVLPDVDVMHVDSADAALIAVPALLERAHRRPVEVLREDRSTIGGDRS